MYWIAFLVPFLLVVAGLVLSVATRRSRVTVNVGVEVLDAAELGRRRSTRRLRLTLVLAPTVGGLVAAGIIASYQDDTGTDWLLSRSSFLIISPLLISCISAALIAFVPKYAESTARRTAELARRSFLTFASRRAFLFLSIATVVLAGVTIVFGVIAAPNGESLFYFYGHHYAGGGGIFPGFVYGIPVLVSLVLLTASVWLTLHRIARAPRPTDEGLQEADALARRANASVVTALATFSVTLTLAVVVLMAGSAFWDVADGTSVDRYGNAVPVNFTAEVLAVLSHVGVGLGVGLLVVAIYFLVHAVSSTTGASYRLVTPEVAQA